MVHRPADSRLLVNLLAHEKDYSKHLSNLLEYSQASLASFSAYAAASAPPTSQVIVAVAGALARADDGLRNYAVAVERWQERLKALKNMELDVGNIMRDREILVTRLIKASKQHKPTRDSGLSGSPSGSSLSVAIPEVQLGSRLSSAQAELQACEAQLAAKEQELNAFRHNTIRSGLQERCKAMVECGWAWGEMGKEGLRALETLELPNGTGSPRTHPYPFYQHPLANGTAPGHPSSDISSIGPSQSASQLGHTAGTIVDPTWRYQAQPSIPTPPKPYTLNIPPAHSISELTMPNGTLHPPVFEEETGGSSADEDEEPNAVEVHENARFGGKGRGRPRSASVSQPPSRHVSFSVRGPKATGTLRRDESPTKTKSRTVLGSIASFFHVGSSRGEGYSPTKSAGGSGRWQTRTDKNISGRKDDSSDDEAGRSYSAVARSSSQATFDIGGDNAEMQRLKKRALKRASAQTPPKIVYDTDKGWVSDDVTDSIGKARGKGPRQRKSPARHTSDASPLSMHGTAGPSSGGRLKKSPTAPGMYADPQVSLSRNSSISKQSVLSVASAPARTPTTAHVVNPSPLGRHNSVSRQRTASLNVTPTYGMSGTITATAIPNGHKRGGSTSTPRPGPSGEQSLMTIVEGIEKMNRDAAMKQDPNRMLVVPRAPGPINIRIDPDPFSTSYPTAQPTPTPRPRSPKPPEENYRNSLLLGASASAPSLPLMPDTSNKPLPVKMPLRSALRNTSRTPSPAPPQPLRPAPALQNGNASAPPSKPPEPRPPAATPPPSSRRVSTSSISSYETGHEEFFTDDESDQPVASSSSPPIPPANDPPPPPPPEKAMANGSELSQSTDSTATAGGTGTERPARKKSVRMSLPPTFSATPPAVEFDDSERGHAPWSAAPTEAAQWASRAGESGQRDMWQDSSDEDAEYSAARRLLARVGRKT